MSKMNFSERVNGIFAAMDTCYDEVNNLMQDLALGREMFDEETGRAITKAEANAKIKTFSKNILGIEDGMSRKEIDRAMRDNARAWFDIIEDTVDRTIEVGLLTTDWFNDLVEYKNLAYTDRQDFIIESNSAILSVAKAGESHHDHIAQRLAGRQTITIPAELYVVKVAEDINRYLFQDNGDWARLINAIAKAYEVEIMDQIYAEVDTIAAKMPVTDTRFINTGALTTATKDDFDAIIENVMAYNSLGPNGIVIMGTKSALAKLSGLTNIQWASDSMKEDIYHTGLIGQYEGVKLVVVPNRFKDATMTAKVFNSKKILILPAVGDEGRFVKMVDYGSSRILIKDQIGDYLSDLQTYEVQRKFGIGSVVGRQIGQWTLP